MSYLLRAIGNNNYLSALDILTHESEGINDLNVDGRTPLILECTKVMPNFQLIHKMLEYPECDIHVVDKFGCNALRYLIDCRESPEQIITYCKRLIDRGIDVNNACQLGITPLMCAAERSLELTNLLLSKPKININSFNKRGYNAFHYAMWGGGLSSERIQRCKSLLNKGFDINSTCPHGQTSLIMFVTYTLCCNNQNIEIIDFLLSAGTNPFIKDHGGRDVLAYNRFETIKNIILRYRIKWDIVAALSAKNTYCSVIPRDIREYIILMIDQSLL